VYQNIEIEFGTIVEIPNAWTSTLIRSLGLANENRDYMVHVGGGSEEPDGRVNRTSVVKATSPTGFDFPPGFERLLDSLVGVLCEAYNKANPTLYMWPSGCGSKPLWSIADAMFLGRSPDAGAAGNGEPMWDDSTYQISCAVIVDDSGSNKWNPRGEELRAERRARHAARRAKNPQPTSIFRVEDDDSRYVVCYDRPLTNDEFQSLQDSIK
jgi:hypothetical protein